MTASPAPWRIVGFRPARPMCGDMLTRGLGKPQPGAPEPSMRWCAQCYAIWEWLGSGWTHRDCAVCRYRSGVAYAYGKIVGAMATLIGYDAECHGSPIISWGQFGAELAVCGVSLDQFLSGDLDLLRQVYRHCQDEYKRQHPAPAPQEAA